MSRCSGLTPYELKKLHSSYKENRSETRFELWEFLFLILKNVYPYQIKTVIIMAKFELKFIDAVIKTDFIKVNVSDQITEEFKTQDFIRISGTENEIPFEILLDKSTAIKFAKTLRTEINKITESEVNNG